MKYIAIFAFLLGNTAFRYDYPKNASDVHSEGFNETHAEGITVNGTGEFAHALPSLKESLSGEPEKNEPNPDSDDEEFHFDDHEPTEVDVDVDIETDYEEENFTMQVHKTTHKKHKQIKPLETREAPKQDPTVDYSAYNGDEKKKKQKEKEKEEAATPHQKLRAAMQSLMCPKKKEMNLAFENGIFFGVFLACLVYAVIHILKTSPTWTTYLLLAAGFFLLFLWYEEENILGETLFIEEKILGLCG